MTKDYKDFTEEDWEEYTRIGIEDGWIHVDSLWDVIKKSTFNLFKRTTE